MSLEDFDRFFTSMKETKLTKRIFAVFVAFIVILLIACGDLQSFAFINYCIVDITSANVSVARVIQVLVYDFGTDYIAPNSAATYNLELQYNDPIAELNLVPGHYYRIGLARRIQNSDGWYWQSWNFSINGNEYSYNFSLTDPDFVTFYDVYEMKALSLRAWGSKGGYISGLYSATSNNMVTIYMDPATPTPEPTPTPTPTPDPTPTPEPTYNPDQPTYYTFFNHLLNDGNNALNALYLSWTSANNKFYTGIFFIGLPIMIGIFGIVASIFFGGDD